MAFNKKKTKMVPHSTSAGGDIWVQLIWKTKSNYCVISITFFHATYRTTSLREHFTGSFSVSHICTYFLRPSSCITRYFYGSRCQTQWQHRITWLGFDPRNAHINLVYGPTRLTAAAVRYGTRRHHRNAAFGVLGSRCVFLTRRDGTIYIDRIGRLRKGNPS